MSWFRPIEGGFWVSIWTMVHLLVTSGHKDHVHYAVAMLLRIFQNVKV